MAFTSGTRLGPYEILSPLGAGGMGEVYRAKDQRLGREVAIKVLPESVAQDRERLSRFEQEARSASALNHPNIVTVHEIGREGNVSWMAMELVEGRSLRDLLAAGPLPMRRLLTIAPQVADGLAKAHSAGIVHRDLKPDNLMVSADGFVKILDFGLAKLSQGSSDSLSRAPTEIGPRTLPGAVLGTVVYMSPEQASGEEVDYRSDQFSLGSILYEMATGKKAFERGKVVDTLSAILHEEPEPLRQARPDAPDALSWLVERCLAKTPEERYASTKDLARDLSNLRDRFSQTSGSTAAMPASHAASRRSTRERVAWAVAGSALVIAATSAIFAFSGSRDRPRLLRASLDIPQNPSFGILAVSPDGSRLAYAAPSGGDEDVLWVRPLDSLDAQELPGTKGARMPFWSPDGRFLGFFAEGKLKKIAAAGGPPQVLCDAPSGRGGAWSPEGVILFAAGYTGALSKVSASQGGRPSPVTRLDHDFSHRWPSFLPDGRHFVFLKLMSDPDSGQPGQANAVFAGSLDSVETRLVTRDASNAVFVEPGYLLFARAGNLLAQRFDPARLDLHDEPFAVSRQLVSLHKRWGFAEFSVSKNGLLAYKPPFASRSQLAWLDRKGREIETIGEPGFYREARLSPDGAKIGVIRFEPETGEGDIWVYEKDSKAPTRFTFQPAHYERLVWSADGGEIFFSSNTGGIQDIYRKSGSGSIEPVLKTDLWKTVSDVSPDGRHLVFHKQDPKTGFDLWAMPLRGNGKPFPILETPFNEAFARYSPDGRWLAYMSDESGRDEVHVRAFPGPSIERPVSPGAWPAWRRDGKELFYLSHDGKMMSAEVLTPSDFRIGGIRPLFDLKDVSSFDVSPDGQRFLVLKQADTQRPSPITLVVNWTSQLPK